MDTKCNIKNDEYRENRTALGCGFSPGVAAGIVLLLAGFVFIMFTAMYVSIAAQTDVSPFRVDYL